MFTQASFAKFFVIFALCAVATGLAACERRPPLPKAAGYGANPQLPDPRPTPSWWPYVNVAPAVGWREGEKPSAAQGLGVEAFATGLDHPRWLYELPNGDILVAETDAPPRPQRAGFSIRATAERVIMKRAGSHRPSANRITLLRDADHDGIAEKHAFLENLNSPFGMALVGDQLYVANADALMRFPYVANETRIKGAGEKVTDLPAGRNHHWTKSLLASKNGLHLYVGVGSNSNAAENGMEEEKNRAAILAIDPKTGASHVYASGLRNPVGMGWNPATGQLWVAVNERDELGDDLVPDYMTSVRPGAFYGWPYSYFGRHLDPRVKPQNMLLAGAAVMPDYALGSHTASLGLAFVDDSRFGDEYASGAFIGQHGSWNRYPLAGYRVIFVPFENGKPSGPPKEILTGFLNANNEARGRPVGVLVDHRGNLLVADDVGGVVWRVRADGAASNGKGG
jgi:glucose/arabinose dehydrogenase